MSLHVSVTDKTNVSKSDEGGAVEIEELTATESCAVH